VYGKNGKAVTYTDKNGKERILQRKYQPKEIEENERSIKMIVREQLPVGFVPFRKGVIVHRLHYVFPPISTLKKSEKLLIEHGGIVHKTTKPDLTDNLSKSTFDSMQGIVFLNDSQICEMNNVKKYYGTKPGIIIELEEITK
jgi:Holliday junction resolvase RusA-like endonuclease